MNRFEAMLAPPTLSKKDMAMHAKMQTAIPREEANILRAELLVPKNRLYDELSTLRFRKPGPDEASAPYQKACRALTSASGEGIPYRFFKAEFLQLADEMGIRQDGEAEVSAKFKVAQVKKAVDELTDPWRIQAYAALCARIAENSETQDPSHAFSAWNKAFKLYQRFFKTAKAEDSTTYQQQDEEKMRQDTVAAWNSFQKYLVDGIAARLKGYIQEKQVDSVAACLRAMGTSYVKAIDKTAYKKALDESFLPYINALKSASSLNEAAALYEKLPAALLEQDSGREFPRAMLSAMSKELKRLQESGGSVEGIISWIQRAGTAELYQDQSPLVKKATADFYGSCAVYIRDVINGSKHERAGYADALISMLPEDILIARNDDKPLYRKDFIGICTTVRIRAEYEAKLKTVRTESTARTMGSTIERLIRDSLVEGSKKDDTLSYILTNLIVTVQKSGMPVQCQRAFFSCFDDKLPLSDQTLKNIGAFKKMMEPQNAPLPPGIKALAAFANAKKGTQDQLLALYQLLDYALQHPNEDVQGEKYVKLATAACQNAFIGALNERNTTGLNPTCHSIMSLAASFLPMDHAFPAGNGRKLPLSELESSLHLEIDQDMRKKAAKTLGYRTQAKISLAQIGRILKQILKGLLPCAVLYCILFSIYRIKKAEPPTGIRYVMLLLQLSMAFQLPLGLSTACLKESGKGMPGKFWSAIQYLSAALFLPTAVYLSLQFFDALPLKTWMIVLFVLYGILCLLLPIYLAHSERQTREIAKNFKMYNRRFH